MPRIDVDGIRFEFPEGWQVDKYDEWAYYKAYLRAQPGTKAVDLLAISPEKTAWLIEVKDYRRHIRTKTIDICEEVAKKVHDTLAALLACQTMATDDNEQKIAKLAARARKLRVVLHLEQPKKPSKLYPRAFDPANVKIKLKSLLKQIDPHPLVVEIDKVGSLGWATHSVELPPA